MRYPMYFVIGAALTMLTLGAGDHAAAEGLDLKIGGEPWLYTVTTPHDPDNREETYKVFTHLYDFEGDDYITKGAGGKYSHHRGLFIGWKDTLVDGEDYDTWHMPNCYQQHIEWIRKVMGENRASQMQVVEWRNLEDEPFIREVRFINARRGENGVRLIDFGSELKALETDIELKGDLQHAGMQIRMANEVSEHEESTRYLLPEGAEELDDDKVVGAWWVMGSVIVNEKRYWVVHMTPKIHPTGEPVYSIRRYARFGAFFETTLEAGYPQQFQFRIVLSPEELTREDCERLYAEYNEHISPPEYLEVR